MTSLADQLWEDAGQPLCEEFYGVPVTLTRSGVASESFTAIADSVDYQVFDSNGFLTSVTSRDYTLPIATTAINGAAIMPRAGDLITETINGVSESYEITPLGNKPAVHKSPDGTQWLVHTNKAQ